MAGRNGDTNLPVVLNDTGIMPHFLKVAHYLVSVIEWQGSHAISSGYSRRPYEEHGQCEGRLASGVEVENNTRQCAPLHFPVGHCEGEII
jgi:hypothetical protein